MAEKFLKQYGSMENLLAHTHELKGKMKEKVGANKELGLLSKELATIILDCPVEFHEEDFELNHPDLEKTNEIFKELEFRRIAESLPKIFKSHPEVGSNGKTENKEVINKAQSSSNQQFDLFSTPSESSSSDNSSFGYKTNSSSDHLYQYVNTSLSRKLLIDKLLQQKSYF